MDHTERDGDLRFGLWEPLSVAVCVCENEPRWQVRQLVNLPKDGAYVSAKCTWCGFIFQYKLEAISDEIIIEENWREMDLPENVTWPSDGTEEIIERLRSVWNQENPLPFRCLCGAREWQLAGIFPFDRGANHRFRYRSDVKLRCLRCGYMALFGRVDEYGSPETHKPVAYRSLQKVE